MKVGRGKWKWCTAISVVAVGVFAFSVTLRGAPADKWNDGRPATVAGEKITIGPGIPHGSGLRVLPPMRGDYRNKDTTVTRTQNGAVAIGPWPTTGGSVASMPLCGSNEQCSDCNYCTEDICTAGTCGYTNLIGPYLGCNDEVFCNGEEDCGGGSCTPGPPPCTGGQICDEQDDICLANPECTLDTDCNDDLYCTSDTCVGGACENVEDLCGPGGGCNEPVPPTTGPQCIEGRCCVGDACTAVTYAACAGAWIPTDDGCGTLQPSGAINDCPDYSSGIAPQGAYVAGVGPISMLACDVDKQVGDDYQTNDNPGSPYMNIELLRFVGNVMSEWPARWRIAFYDENGFFVEDLFWPDGQDQDPTFEFVVNTVDFDPPLLIPTKGYIAWSVQPNFSPGGRVQVMATDVVDVGTNDAGKMWYNGDDVPDHLAGIADVLAFEIVGSTVASAPLGACCNSETAVCTDELPWVCAGQGNIFQGIGVPCKLCTSGPRSGLLCEVSADCNNVCNGGTNAGQHCTVPGDCPGGTCDTSGVHICTTLPACAKQACCEADGDCVEVMTPDPCPVGTTELGYGTNCNIEGQPAGSRNCCEQTPTGGDTCLDVTLHVINVPGVGSDPVSVTMTGTTANATYGDYPAVCSFWAPDSLERGWWEGFSIDDCAMVRIDLCCSDVYGDVVRPAWGNLVQDCPCGSLLQNAGVEPPIGIGIGTSGFARGEPFCIEDNLWQTFGPIPAGSYFYPVYTVPDGTTGVPPGGPYQLHVTVGACPLAACCMGATCAVMNQLDCEDNDGYWLAPPNVETAVIDCGPPNPCITGSCCNLEGPGSCKDEVTVGTPMTEPNCTPFGGEYVGGAKCDNPGNPCPICEIQDSSNCQLLSPTVATVTMSDLSAPGGSVARADDFKAAGNTITTVCAWGAYLDGSQPDGAFGCSEAVTDNFRVTVFGDAGGMPNDQDIKGTSLVAVLSRAPYPNADMDDVNETYYETVYADNVGEPMFAYQMVLATPITGLVSGTCYWLEIVNNTPADEGDPPNSCEWNWAHTQTNEYSFEGSYTSIDPPVPIYGFGGQRGIDMAFCVDCGMDAGGCGTETKRACCTCYDADPPIPPSSCTSKTFTDCVGGIWDMTEDSCTGYQCPTAAPTGDVCANAVVVTGADTPTGVSFLFDSTCAETNGPGGAGVTWQVRNENGGLVGFGSEIWYKYVSECTGRLQISQCGAGSGNDTFDGMIAVFHNNANPTACPCPGQTGFLQNGNGDDESCTGIADGGQGWLARTTTEGDCWMITAGGFEGAGGLGSMNVKCIEAGCTQSLAPLVGPLGDTGNGTRVRYLAFAPQVDLVPGPRAVRVKFTDLPDRWNYADGRRAWVGAPIQVSEVAGLDNATPPTFWVAELVCDPVFIDWAAYPVVYIRGESLVPGGQYNIQMVADDCPLLLEDSYSPALAGKLSKWGDAVGASYAASPQGTVDFTDISSAVDKFKNLPTAPSKTRVDVAPSMPNRIVDFGDIPAIVDAFRGLLYPYFGPPVVNPCP